MENNGIATSLREKVFQTCQEMESNGQKITRDAVRAITGGSYRDLSKYIAEWRDSRQLVVQETQSEVILERQDSGISDVENDVEILDNQQLEPHPDITEIVHKAADIATELILTEQSLVSYFIENPHQLPEHQKQQIQDNSAVIKSKIQQNYKEKYNSQLLTKKALDQIKKK
jgi:hypothetical protein